MAAATESKVYGATIGGGAGAIVTSFVLWLFGVFVFGVPSDADSAGLAIGAVPLPLAGVITAVLTLGSVYAGGWLAKHTPRADDEYVAKRALVEPTPVWDDTQVVVNEPAPSDDESYPVPEYAV